VPLGAVVDAVFPVWVRLVIVVVTLLNAHPSVPVYMFSCSENLNAFSYLPNPPYGVIALPASSKRLPDVVAELPSPIVSIVDGSVVPMPKKPCWLRVRPVEVAAKASASVAPRPEIILNISLSESSTPSRKVGCPSVSSN